MKYKNAHGEKRDRPQRCREPLERGAEQRDSLEGSGVVEGGEKVLFAAGEQAVGGLVEAAEVGKEDLVEGPEEGGMGE
jgi:hypothetical protein